MSRSPNPPVSPGHRATVAAVVLVVVVIVVTVVSMGVHDMITSIRTDVTPGPDDRSEGLALQAELREAGAVAVAQHGRTGAYPRSTAELIAGGYSPAPNVTVTVGAAGKNAPYDFCVNGYFYQGPANGVLYSLYLSPSRPSKLIAGGCSS